MKNRPPIRYRIRPSDPAAHLFEVDCIVADPDPAGQRFALPAWIPGSYLIRDYARMVRDLTVVGDDGAPRAATKIDKSTWRIVRGGAPCSRAGSSLRSRCLCARPRLAWSRFG